MVGLSLYPAHSGHGNLRFFAAVMTSSFLDALCLTASTPGNDSLPPGSGDFRKQSLLDDATDASTHRPAVFHSAGRPS